MIQVNAFRTKFLFSVCLFLVYSFWVLWVSSRQMPPTGDEPHYLITAHSLAVDGDLYLLNNYKERDYRIFYPGQLAKRTTLGADPSKELPAFSPGLSFLLTPFYKLALSFFPTFLIPFLRLIICCVTTIALYQLIGLAETFGARPSMVVLAGAALASPLITYSSQFYPEIVGFLFVVIALLQFQRINDKPWQSFVWLSILTPALLWLHPKYLVLSLIVFLISCFLFNRLRKTTGKFVWIQVFYILISLAGITAFFIFLHSFYGSWSPNRIYGGAQKNTSMLELIQTLGWERIRVMLRMMFGYWLDERFGLIPYAPLYAAFFSAFVWAIKQYRFQILPAIILFAAHFVLICWAAQMGGYSPPSRHMVVLLSVILLPLLLIYSQWNIKQKVVFVVLAIAGWIVSIGIVTHYRLIFTDATWRNPDGGSVFWTWAGMEKWIPNLTATSLNLSLIISWICVIFLISVALYPKNSRKQSEPFSRR